MKTIGDLLLVIGDRIEVLCYATKYWLRGEDWEDALIAAKNIVEVGWWR